MDRSAGRGSPRAGSAILLLLVLCAGAWPRSALAGVPVGPGAAESATVVEQRGGGQVSGYAKWLQDVLGLSTATQGKLLTSLGIFLGLWLLRLLVLLAVGRKVEDTRVRYMWRKTTLYLAVILALLLVGPLWVKGIEDTATFLGLLSAGLAVAFRDVLVDLAGWLYIVGQKPFRVGDRVEIAEYSGDVIDSGPLMFTVLEIGKWVHADQSTGRMCQVPNALVFTRPLVNYTKGFRFIWNEIPVLVTFESDWKKAKKLLLEIAERHGSSTVEQAAREMKNASRQFMLIYGKLTPTVYTSVQECGVVLTLRYLCEVQKRRDSAQAIWEDVLAAVADNDDVDFAYPTRRVYRLKSEGKTVRDPDERPGEAPLREKDEDGAA
jgi:small-conductance mechanosensitive channel